MSQIIVTYRHTRRLSIRIGRNGDVRVSVPLGVSKTEVYRFIDEHHSWIEKAQAKTIQMQQRRLDFFSQLELKKRKERSEAIAQLDAIVSPLIEQYASKMKVSPSAINYRATISRWGCCNVKTKAIQFSLYMLLLPHWCIESIVVHELAHLLVPNHSPEFYSVLDLHFPRWREARTEIKRISMAHKP